MGRQRISMHAAAGEALRVLAQQIRTVRIQRGWTIAELAEATGLTRDTISSIEKATPSVSVGNVLNVAAVVGVPLFGVDDPAELTLMRRRGEERLALLPARVDKPRKVAERDLDF